jgi:hypothetical protein
MGAAPIPGLTLTGANLRTRLTIPGVGGRLADLIQAAEPGLGVQVATVLILADLPTSTPGVSSLRAGFTVADPRPGASAPTADDYALRGQPVGAGEDYTSPSVGDLDSWFKAASDTPAIAVLFW